MKIIEDEENGIVIIDSLRIDGFVCDDICPNCKNYKIMHEKYDAIFCAYCNEWRETKCSDPKCEYCTTRPEKPL